MHTPEYLRTLYDNLQYSPNIVTMLESLSTIFMKRAEDGKLATVVRFREKGGINNTLRESNNTPTIDVFVNSVIKEYMLERLVNSGFDVDYVGAPYDVYSISWKDAQAIQNVFIENGNVIPNLTQVDIPFLSAPVGASYVLPEPDRWIDFGDYVIPCYTNTTLGIT